jgi:hypothetical protein
MRTDYRVLKCYTKQLRKYYNTLKIDIIVKLSDWYGPTITCA